MTTPSGAKKLRILVTGGTGFLGSNLCRRLVREGHDVICLDNLFTSDKRNIEDLLPLPNFEFIRHDVCQPILLEVDHIYHLACPASPPHYQWNPIHTVKTCVLGAINMLGLAKRCRARILFTSTSEVYGDPDDAHHPQTEDYRGNVNPIGPRSCYDEGKRCAETIFYDYHRMHGVDIRIVRIFNTYGPRMHPFDGRVITNFVIQALQNDPITLYGDGKQTRSFCFVDDLLDAIQAMMLQDGFLGPVNIGNPGEFTIRELADHVVRLTGSKSTVTQLPAPADDPLQRRPDISLAKEKLHWEPKIALEEGLKRTIEYFRGIDVTTYRKPTDYTHHTIQK
eukprot:TRINITY_DN56270_c0_g1_i1.p1 TRINITY_DN56270_c0_g1~~TRINITY_DN56270_c0_g1_i1.p1  ORF type:complete len:347 (-),score=73.87 TRINITY_DN56270_c0_g1_i1:492-1502(-)